MQVKVEKGERPLPVPPVETVYRLQLELTEAEARALGADLADVAHRPRAGDIIQALATVLPEARLPEPGSPEEAFNRALRRARGEA